MGVSFKVARTGTRYRPSSTPPDAAAEGGAESPCPELDDRQVGLLGLGDGTANCVDSSANCEKGPEGQVDGQELAASFSLNLFPDGFSIGKPTEGMLLPLVKDVPKLLHPYDISAKGLFSAIERGCLPGEIFDDLPCKYSNGSLICEVWDYRSCVSKMGSNDSSGDDFPKVQKVRLRMGLETVVKDLPSISDESWTYNDLLQAEAKIIKALQPVLYLAPNPSLDRLCRAPVSTQLDLGIYNRKLKREYYGRPEAGVKCSGQSHKVDIPSNMSEPLKSQKFNVFKGDGACPVQSTHTSMPIVEQNNFEKEIFGQVFPSNFQSNCSSTINSAFSLPNNIAVSSSIVPAPDEVPRGTRTGLKDAADIQLKKTGPCLKPALKRPKQEAMELDPYQIVTGKKAKLLEPDLQGKVTLLCSQQDAYNRLHPRSDSNHPLVTTNNAISATNLLVNAPLLSALGDKNVKGSLERGPLKTRNLSKPEALNDKDEHALDVTADKTIQKRAIPFTKSLPPQIHWINAGPSREQPTNKEISSRKKKRLETPQFSVGHSLDSQLPLVQEKQKNRPQVSNKASQGLPTVESSKDKAVSAPVASSGNATANSSCNSTSRAKQTSSRTKKSFKPIMQIPSLCMSGAGSQGAAGDSSTPLSSKCVSVMTESMQSLQQPNSNHSILERFSSIDMVVQRHGLNKRKKKHDNFLATRSLPHMDFAQYCLIMADDTETLVSLADKICMSKCLLSGSRNTCKTRILSYRRPLKIVYKSSIMPNLLEESSSKLVLSKSDEPNDHQIGVEIIYGDEEERVHLELLPTAHHADLFAEQFTLLMEKEGYELMNDQFQPLPGSTTSTSNSNLPYIGFQGSIMLPCTANISDQSPKGAPFTTNSVPTLNLHGYGSLNALSALAPPSSLNLTRPQQLEFAPNLNSVHMLESADQRLSLFMQNNSMSSSGMQMPYQIPDHLTSLQHLRLQHFRRQHYQKNMMADNLESMGNTLEIGGHIVDLNDPGLSAVSHTSRGTPPIQAAVIARLNQSQGLGTRALDGLPMRSTSQRTDQNQPRAKPLVNLGSNNYDLLEQHNLQQAMLRQSEQWQHQRQLQQPDLPQHYASALVTQMSQSTPISPNQFSSGSALQHVNDSVGNIGSPQLSGHTAGSVGSITSSPMKLQCIKKGNAGGSGCDIG